MLIKIINKLFKKFQKYNQPSKINIETNNIYKYHLNLHTDNKKNYKLKIITSHDENYNEIGNITKKTMRNYAQKFGFEFEFLEMPNTGRSQTWNKIISIKDQILKKNHDFIMWLDADAFFPNDAENVVSILNDNHEIYLSNHYCSVHKGSNYKNTILTTNRINCGVMIFKVSEFNINFLNKVWSSEKYINHHWFEQAAIMDLIGLKADITGNLNDNQGNDFYLEKIKFISKEWNSIPSFNEISTESIRPSIIHLAGIENKERIKFLNDYIKRGKI